MDNIIQEYTTLSQWGNSKATRIPTNILKLLNIDVNQKFLVSVKDRSIVLTPESQNPSSIHDLFAGWEDHGVRHREIELGESKGEELTW